MAVPAVTMRVDHLKAIADPMYRAIVRGRLTDLVDDGPNIIDLTFEHEHNYSCCRRESYPATLLRLTGMGHD